MGFIQKTIQILGKTKDHFWFVHRNKIIERTLKQHFKKKSVRNLKILEIGCGGCQISNYLHQKGYSLTASDIYASSKTFLEPEIEFFMYSLDDNVPLKHLGQFDCIILGDVIEHLKTPPEALLKAVQFLKTKGVVVVTVPALTSLWSDYDEISGHVMRYDKHLLSSLFQQAGLRIRGIDYFMLLPAMILLFQRKILPLITKTKKGYQDSLEINHVLNLMFKKWLSLEFVIAFFLKFPFGSSLIITGQKAD